MPGDRWARLKVRGYGLYIYATREGQTLEKRVESDADFESACEWLQDLPKYK